LYWRQRVHGRDNVPAGGAILAANHQAGIDPALICMCFWRPVRWLAKVELVKKRRIAWFFRAVNVIPIDREAPQQEAIDAAAAVVVRGQLFGIFPEGTRSPDGRVYKGYTGVARIAAQTGAPVVPTGVVGTAKAIRKGSILAKPVRCEVRFGQPMHFSIGEGEDEHAAYRRFTEEVLDAVAKLIDADRVRDRYSREPVRRAG
jgi:1-acyl-sn-glycerol-3-phosphate acyltransferase